MQYIQNKKQNELGEGRKGEGIRVELLKKSRNGEKRDRRGKYRIEGELWKKGIYGNDRKGSKEGDIAKREKIWKT